MWQQYPACPRSQSDYFSLGLQDSPAKRRARARGHDHDHNPLGLLKEREENCAIVSVSYVSHSGIAGAGSPVVALPFSPASDFFLRLIRVPMTSLSASNHVKATFALAAKTILNSRGGSIHRGDSVRRGTNPSICRRCDLRMSSSAASRSGRVLSKRVFGRRSRTLWWIEKARAQRNSFLPRFLIGI